MSPSKLKDHLKKVPYPSVEEAFEKLRDSGITRKALRDVWVPLRDARELAKFSQSNKQKEKEAKDVQKQLAEALEKNELLEQKLNDIVSVTKPIKTYEIKKHKNTKGSEAVPVLVASDWHVEEEVKPETVNGLNTHNLKISKERSERFFQRGLRLIEITAKDTEVKQVVVALLGDFFSNDIHDELAEVNLLTPVEACIRAQEYIASGLKFLLDNSPYDIKVVCCVGNHSRTTDNVYFSNEHGHSFEYYMYMTLESFFRHEPRIDFSIKPSYLNVTQILNTKVRFHHGHAIKGGGGIGGIYPAVGRKLAQWNKAGQVDLDVFGHFHTLKHGGNFIANGSSIGYNAYALRYAFDYERPQQAYFVIHSKYGQTNFAPIILED